MHRWIVFTAVSGLLAASGAAASVRLTGHVARADGGPLVEARIELHPVLSNHAWARGVLAGRPKADAATTTPTDADGRFVLDAPAPGLFTVEVARAGLVPMRYGPLPLVRDTELPPVALVADAGTRLTVLDAQGALTEDVWVYAQTGSPAVWENAGRDGWRPGARLGRGGRLALPRAPGEKLTVHAFLPTGTGQRFSAVGEQAVLRLAPESAVRTLTVLDESGSALAGTVVAVGEVAWPVGVIGGDGRLRLRGDFSRPLDLFLLGADGRWLRTRLPASARSGAAEPLSFRLSAPARVVGRVLTAESRPLPGALVWPTHDPGRFAVTDGEGAYELDAASADPFRLRAEADGFLPGHGRLSATAGERRQADVLVLERARAGRGRVVDGEQQPLAGARIRVWASAGPPRDAANATSDAEGRFEIAALPDPRIEIEARKPGFSPLRVRAVEIAGGEGALDLGTLVMLPGVSVEGRVVDPDGKPVAEAGVWALAAALQLPQHLDGEIRRRTPDVLTEADGCFTLPDLESGAKLHLVVHRRGFLPARQLGVEAPTGEPLAVELLPASEVHGQVLDEAGEPIAEARLLVEPAPPPAGTVGVGRPRQGSRELTADDEGRFTVDGLEPGRLEVRAAAGGFQPGSPETLELAAGEIRQGVTLVLARGAVVEGRVLSRDGAGVAGARLRLSEVTAVSDAEGFYRLEGVPPGEQFLFARHLEFDQQAVKVEVVPGVNPVDVVLTGGWAVSGRVVEAGGGAEVAEARVELILDGNGELRRYQATSGVDGRFELPRVVDGTYRLTAGKPGYGTVERERALLVDGSPVDDLEVRLPVGTLLAGRVVGLGFEELAAVEVEAEDAGELRRAGTVDYAGRYEIRDLGPGVWQVVARLPGGHRQAEARVTVAAGKRRIERDLEFGGLTLDGQLLYGGEVLPEARVSLLGRDLAVRRSVVTDHQGRFRLADLKPGRYVLGASHAGLAATHQQEVELFADDDIVVEIVTARLAGTVVSAADGEPLDDALVRLERRLGGGIEGEEGSQSASVTTVATSEQGSFTAERLSAGRYRLAVSKDGYAPREEVLDLAAGQVLDLELSLAPTEGLELVVLLDSGRPPPRATLSVLDAQGRPLLSQTRFPTADGGVRFPTVPAGEWEAVVSAPGGATRRLRAEVPGPTLELVLAAADRLEVQVPELVASNQVATVALLDQDGGPFESVGPYGSLQREWRLDGGVGIVDGVPAGLWTVRVVAGGRLWERTLAIGGGGRVEVVLE